MMVDSCLKVIITNTWKQRSISKGQSNLGVRVNQKGMVT